MYKRQVQEGSTILLDDGLIELTVRGIRGGDIVCRVQNDGFISNNKGVNVPNVHLSMPFTSERDREDIISVSYTHLDVYKRQALGRCRAIEAKKDWRNSVFYML